MDLKIKDVAELLNVSETTIRRWLGDGKIPSYKIENQHRFSRNEIEDWVMKQKLSNSPHASSDFHHSDGEEGANKLSPPSSGGSKQFSLFRSIHKGDVLLHVPGKNKEELIRNAVKAIASQLHFDAEVITELLLEREHMQSTALNNGIAIPHTRDFLLNSHHDVVTVVIPETPIPYDALDGEPVHTLFFLFASDDRHHLHLLAKIAHLSSKPETIDLLLSKPTKEQLLDYIKGWEGSIQKVGVKAHA